jgi:hypothetical protein
MKAIAIAFVSEFEHVTAKIVTHCFDPVPDVATDFFGQAAQLFASFLADVNSIPHFRILQQGAF